MGAFGKPKCAEIVCFWLFGFRFVALSLCVLSPSSPHSTSAPTACTLCCHDFFLNESVKQSVTFCYDILCPVGLVIYVMLPLPLPNVRSIYPALVLAFVCYLLTFCIYSAVLRGNCVYIKISKYNSRCRLALQIVVLLM